MKEKVLGEKDTCSFCKCEVICGSTSYQGETKLQWQNPDGKAHYKPNKGGCNMPSAKPVSATTEYAAALNVEAKIPHAPMDKIIDEATKIVLSALKVADEQVSAIYEGLDKKSNVYGQIRSKFAEDIIRVYCALILKKQ